MSYQLATVAMGVGTFTAVDLGAGYTGVTILAEAECAVKVVGPAGPAPSTPGSNPLPTAGSGNSVTGWQHLRAGDPLPLGFDPPPNTVAGAPVDATGGIRYVAVWGIAQGYLQITTTRG